MSCHSENKIESRLIRGSLVAVAALAVSACSADMSRLSYVGSQPVMVQQANNDIITGSTGQTPYYSTPVSSSPVASAPTSTVPTYGEAVASAPQVNGPVYGQPQTIYQPPINAAPQPAYQQASYPSATAKLPSAPETLSAAPAVKPPKVPQTMPAVASTTGKPQIGWTAAGGSLVTVAPGQTTSSIARQYNIPEEALLQVNGLPRNTQLPPGAQIVIPSYNSRVFGSQPATAEVQPARIANQMAPAGPLVLGQMPQTASAAMAAPRPRPGAPEMTPMMTPVPAPATTGSINPVQSQEVVASYVVKSGDTLPAVARLFSVKRADLASVNGLKASDNLRVGQRLIIPKGAQMADAAPVPEAPARPVAPVKAATQSRQEQVAMTSPQQVLSPTTDASAGASAGFRWPVRGRLLSTYGSKGNGERNDGINIEAPQGSVVRAADAGDVVYAGNELQGYGNLVLIKHANGYVTAYAHADELLVHRGDKVQKGQSIATVGSTGSVNKPQLHFEIRANNRPVDPMPYLDS